jgi:hypothetical protein
VPTPARPGRCVTRIYISRRFGLWGGALFTIPFMGMFVYSIWEALTEGSAAIVRGVPPSFPGWTRWIVLVGMLGVLAYLCWSVLRLKRVVLVDDHLLISSLTQEVTIPLEDVLSIQWTQKAEDFNTPEAALVLREPTALGDYIVFEPRSSEAFELLRSRIEHVEAGTTG